MAILHIQNVCRTCGSYLYDNDCLAHPQAVIDGIYIQEMTDRGRYQAFQSEFGAWSVIDSACPVFDLADPCVIRPLLDEATARQEAHRLNTETYPREEAPDFPT